ncbi:MAG: hypothetical protein ACI9MS_001296 [Glaciecola sp.]
MDGVTFYALNAKGISDFESTLADKNTAAGNTTLAQTREYDRKMQHIKTTK